MGYVRITTRSISFAYLPRYIVPKKYIHTEVGGHKLKLSNLEKILYPSIGVTKAQVIQYYLQNAERILEHVGGRALTVIRFPDGLEGQSFYSKDKPDWTPDWIDSVEIQHEEKSIDYLLPRNAATIVWLANLACLELHPMQFISGANPYPDYFVFDLDPDEDLSFDLVKEAAFNLKLFLEKYDYIPFVKTSGGKGLHIIVPILAATPFDVMVDLVKDLTRKFIAQHPKLYTLQVSKAKRKGKILIDIYRNHKSNTTVAPFSLRGKKGAPISMPFYWDHLNDIESAKHFTILNYETYLSDQGYAWEGWMSKARPMHSLKKPHAIVTATDKRLVEYVEKRNLQITPEPGTISTRNEKDAYVLQLHDASSLHYDLRLEDEGVLMSWAIPKGLPYLANQKRLAIRTEDHPLQYLYFEGEIPKGEYGAGSMRIVESGKIKWSQKKKTSFEFTLSGEENKHTYKLFQTNDTNQWLIVIANNKSFVNAEKQVKPMLAQATPTVPLHAKYKYEVKWDGIRVLIYVETDKVKIVSRNGNELTNQFPELLQADTFNIEQGVFDGEIVVLDEQGRPIFGDVISRMHTKGSVAIKSLTKHKPVCCYLFDVLSVDGKDVVELPLKKRRALLEMSIKSDNYFRFSETFEDGEALFSAIQAKGMEGIMAKDQLSTYKIDARSRDWLKIKCRQIDRCLIIGYTAGKGDRVGLFGALLLAKLKKNKLTYLGKVGTGFNHQLLTELTNILKGLDEIEKPIADSIDEESRITWVEPRLNCEIQYASMTANKTYREPVFLRLIEN